LRGRGGVLVVVASCHSSGQFRLLPNHIAMHCILLFAFLLANATCWQYPGPVCPRPPRPVCSPNTLMVAVSSSPAPHNEVEKAVGSLAAIMLALLSGDATAAQALAGSAEQKRETIRTAIAAYDDCASGTLFTMRPALCLPSSRGRSSRSWPQAKRPERLPRRRLSASCKTTPVAPSTGWPRS